MFDKFLTLFNELVYIFNLRNKFIKCKSSTKYDKFIIFSLKSGAASQLSKPLLNFLKVKTYLYALMISASVHSPLPFIFVNQINYHFLIIRDF